MPRDLFEYHDLRVIALRDIEAGEEITHDYGVAWEELGVVPPALDFLEATQDLAEQPA